MIPLPFLLLLIIAVSLPPAIVLFTPIRIRILAEKKGLETGGEIDITLPREATRVRIDLKDELFEVYLFKARILRRNMEKTEKKAEREDRKRGFSFRIEYVKPILRFIYNSIKTFSIERFHLRLTIGLEKAYDTGIICGYLYPLLYPLNAFKNTDVRITPNFNAPTLDGRLEVDIGNRAVRLIHPLFQLSSDLKLKTRIIEKIKDAF
jgi:hypothetical protein